MKWRKDRPEVIDIFICWQGDYNNIIIKNAINETISKIKRQLPITHNCILNPIYDKTNYTGAAPIADAVFQNILDCDLFICDVTPVCKTCNQSDNFKLMPNSNVLLELGFALCCKDSAFIFPIMMEPIYNNDMRLMPFDILNRQIYTADYIKVSNYHPKCDIEENCETTCSYGICIKENFYLDIVKSIGVIISKRKHWYYPIVSWWNRFMLSFNPNHDTTKDKHFIPKEECVSIKGCNEGTHILV